MAIKIIDKKIVLPEIKLFQTDNLSEELNFECERFYNGKDLALCKVYLKFLRSDGFSDKIELPLTSTENTVSFTLGISNFLTSYTGDLKMQICFEKADEFILNTEIFSVEILSSISGRGVVDGGELDPALHFSDFLKKSDLNEALKTYVPLPKVKSVDLDENSSLILEPDVIATLNTVIEENSRLVLDFLDETWTAGKTSILTAKFNGGECTINPEHLPVIFYGDNCEDGLFYPSAKTYQINFMHVGNYISAIVLEELYK